MTALPQSNRSKEQAIIIHVGWNKVIMPFTEANLRHAAEMANLKVYDDVYTEDGYVYYPDDGTEIRIEVKTINIERGYTARARRDYDAELRKQEKAAAAAEEAQSDTEGGAVPTF